MKQVACPRHGQLKRVFCRLCRKHQAAKKGELHRVKGSLAGGHEYVEKIVLNGGAQEIAARPLPYGGPGNVLAQASLQSSSLDPFAGLWDSKENFGLRSRHARVFQVQADQTNSSS